MAREMVLHFFLNKNHVYQNEEMIRRQNMTKEKFHDLVNDTVETLFHESIDDFLSETKKVSEDKSGKPAGTSMTAERAVSMTTMTTMTTTTTTTTTTTENPVHKVWRIILEKKNEKSKIQAATTP